MHCDFVFYHWQSFIALHNSLKRNYAYHVIRARMRSNNKSESIFVLYLRHKVRKWQNLDLSTVVKLLQNYFKINLQILENSKYQIKIDEQ